MTMLSASGRLRTARCAARVVAAIALCALLLTTGDPQAAERDPSHGHIAFGASVIEIARALLDHTHASAARPATTQHACPHPAAAAALTGSQSAATERRVAPLSTAEGPAIITVRAPLASTSVVALTPGAVLQDRSDLAPPALSIVPAAGYATPRWQAPELIALTPPPEAS